MVKLDELEIQRIMEETYQMYAEELISAGSPCDISRSGKDLLACDEILKSYERFNSLKIATDKIRFTKSDVTSISHSTANLIGTLCINGKLHIMLQVNF